MSPTPPGQGNSHDDRTRRNIACVNCRNSKVRCRANQVPGEACQRCAKLQISCVVDKSHKRVTKRSKLEQLEQELKSIKQVVQPAANGKAQSAWTPPSPRAAIPALPDQRSGSAAGINTTTPQPPTPQPESSSSRGHPAQSSERRLKTGPTEARILGNHIVSGEDIDWYFTKYLRHFHRFVPVLRKKDPDDCYEANQTLFWLVIHVACRRYARDRSLFPLLTDHLEKNIWTMSSAPALDFDAVQALLIICTWPMPNIRFVVDPSPTFAGIATTTALGLGCHTGQGKNSQFLVGLRQNFHATDEEASSTWLACCMLSQRYMLALLFPPVSNSHNNTPNTDDRTAASIGIPPPSTQHSDSKAKAALDASQWVDLIIMHDVQRFLNRFHTSMFTQVTAHGGVHESEVAMWETEFESLKPLITKYDSGTHFTDSHPPLALPTLEIQLCYFIWPPNTAVPSIKSHAVRVFNTARSIVAHSLDLEARIQFLAHAPHWATRTNIDAACIIISILHSDCSPGMSEPDAHLLVQQACGAVLRASVRDADLAHRASITMETFWSIRNLVPSFGAAPGARPDRSSAGVTFWCLNKFRTALRDAQNSTDRVNNALEVMQGPCASYTTPSTQPNSSEPQPGNLSTDPIQDVDWTMFMDDFGWVGDDAALLGLP
ncbi:C6 transcription factor (Leu3), putative [Metarhizium acridum CQMa 102]|uniref:C6 transcription factor (Leu3), putative n=1 Tax=Metarhizium acridum (strain CQMa 102) TaxID=655827 RepID=E9E566_METAQ|nr:C6 transcription factor (Leu3), putative [Metarhizium acridum CQMa 102]EFY88941.1 C6 transcription factor (Leu3), putative [Metarhizium acridum CQMa 102]